MNEIGLEKKEGQLPEPEDTLGFEFEIMNWMISKQTSTEDAETEEHWLELHARFLKKTHSCLGPHMCPGNRISTACGILQRSR